ncbi:hypothetical protein M23134_03286 [Microscilla marina ATCC 23134]|uniref:Uncharacterized protein n=1 Tax=Microscilla marina ATCC 23134 TaxID=313606 RepID=A1ZGN1_MICM2|nr:hypothetical protein M23134_03286 [Microscilla marina ATCC 23134]
MLYYTYLAFLKNRHKKTREIRGLKNYSNFFLYNYFTN